jgi:hypothetical protein
METHLIVPYYHSVVSDPNASITSLLATKTFFRIPLSVWEAMRKDAHLPVYRNELQQVRHTLLSPSLSHPLHNEKGAYLDLHAYFEEIVSTYLTQHAIFTTNIGTAQSWKWKLSWDNRYLWGKNEGWSLSPLNTLHLQSPQHVYNVMVAHIPERNIPFTNCVVESNMEDFFGDFENMIVSLNGEEIQQQLILNSDWMAMCCELDCTLPNTANLWKGVCWKCGSDKQILRHSWLEHPFKWYDELLTIHDFPNAALSVVPLSSRRYCWMHGISNLLSNCLTNCHALLPAKSSSRHQFHQTLFMILHNWKPTKALIPKQMKQFFHLKLHHTIPQAFSQHDLHHLPWLMEPHTFIRSTSNTIAMLLDSVRTYFEFAYMPLPSSQDFKLLNIARNCILSVHACFGWRLAPTTHYMTNHAIKDAERDGTAYHTLQEGVEHGNQEDKHEARVTFKGSYYGEMNETAWEHMLNQQRLKLKLTSLDYAPPPYSLEPIGPSFEIEHSKVLKVPIYSPLVELL